MKRIQLNDIVLKIRISMLFDSLLFFCSENVSEISFVVFIARVPSSKLQVLCEWFHHRPMS